MTIISNPQTTYFCTVNIKVQDHDVKTVAAVKKTEGRISDYKNTKDTIVISDEGHEAFRHRIDEMQKKVLTPEQMKELRDKEVQELVLERVKQLWDSIELATGKTRDDFLYSSSGGQNGLFFGSSDSYAFLGKMLGLKGMFSDKSSFLDSLNNQIAGESKALTKDLNALLKKAGLGDVTKKITFSEDANGNIVVEGNIGAKLKKQMAGLVNADSELVERIKTQRARMEISHELEKDNSDLSHEKFNVARTQILKDYLNKNDISLDRIRLEDHESGDKNFVMRDANGNISDGELLHNLLNEFPDLGGEVLAHLGRANATQTAKNGDSAPVRSLLSMKRGVLSEANETKPDFGLQIKSLRESISDTIVGPINEIFKNDVDLQICDYKIRIDSTGRIRITDVQTKGNDPEANLRAASLMNGKINTEMQDSAKILGTEILDAHDDEHGDVLEYKHDVFMDSGINGGYRIESQEADEAAMREIKSLTNDIGSFFRDFFEKTLNVNQPFRLVFDFHQFTLSGADFLSQKDAAVVRQVLNDFNQFLVDEETGRDTKLPEKYSGIGDKLIALKEAKDKLHAPSLLPKDGICFVF